VASRRCHCALRVASPLFRIAWHPDGTTLCTVISHHLKVLREAGLIEGERRATWIYYRVRPQVLRQLSDVLVSGPAGVPA
jgi:regulatory ArsR family protein